MRSPLLTRTGRGLRLALFGELILGLGAVLYFALGRTNWVAGLAFFVAGLVGFLSALRMWNGRREFGPLHEKLARYGVWLFLAAALLFAVAWIGALTTFPQTLRVADLEPPLLVVALALMCEASSGALLLKELSGRDQRFLVFGYTLLAGIGAVAVFFRGLLWVRTLRADVGPTVANEPEARYYLSGYLDQVLPVLMAVFLVTRIVATTLVAKALARVREAEEEAAAEVSAPSPSPEDASGTPAPRPGQGPPT